MVRYSLLKPGASPPHGLQPSWLGLSVKPPEVFLKVVLRRFRMRCRKTVFLLIAIALLLATTAVSAQTFTTLHSFAGLDGDAPYAGLVQATDGNLYGTAQQGGTNEVGTVFKITLSGTLTTLHSFDTTDGYYPYAALVQATNGNLYGTTYRGGANNDGTVFKITSSGTLTSLHSFNYTDGDQPEAGLIQATNGNLYGMTAASGKREPRWHSLQ